MNTDPETRLAAAQGEDPDPLTVAAAIIKPFVREELHWICQNHGHFQGYYYFHYLGMDQNSREKFRGHEHFEACAEFCEKYDQAAFDPDYQSEPLAFFEPMVRRVMARPLKTLYKIEEQAEAARRTAH